MIESMRTQDTKASPYTTLQACILAAGASSRFKTGTTKLAQKICGQAMVLYNIELMHTMRIPTTIVVGFQKEVVQDLIEQYRATMHNGSDLPVNYVVQHEQRGTGDAVAACLDQINAQDLLILNGDLPLVTTDIITTLYEQHLQHQADVSFVIADHPDNTVGAYGRVIMQGGEVVEIIESRDLKNNAYEHCCVNAGIYIVRRDFLVHALTIITDRAKQETMHTLSSDTPLPTYRHTQEIYITDIVKIARQLNKKIVAVPAPFDTVRGVNNFQELWVAEQIKRADIIRRHMHAGVHFSVAQSTHVDLHVTIGSGTYIGCGVQLFGTTQIGAECRIEDFSTIYNAIIGDRTIVRTHSVINESIVASDAQIGPFAHLHQHAVIGQGSIIGNFVEVKRTTVGARSKAKHLAYLGDGTIGSQVNIGAGTVLCNHNGFEKHRTIIHDNVHIGSNNSLVAPLSIGQDVFTAAGSTITHDVPAGALAIARTRQVNKENYARILRAKYQRPTACDEHTI